MIPIFTRMWSMWFVKKDMIASSWKELYKVASPISLSIILLCILCGCSGKKTVVFMQLITEN